MSSVDLSLSGLASGFDWKTLVSQLVEVERSPENQLLTQQTRLGVQKTAYGAVQSGLNALKTHADKLKDASLFDGRAAASSDTSAATVSVGSGAPIGSFAFNITQLATTASQQGGLDIGATLNASDNVSGLTIANAAFSTAVTAGKFTVNGAQVSIATTDSLQDVFDAISTATGGVVTGKYDHLTDTISLSTSNGSKVVLGSATDSSNFLQAARLYNNNSTTVESTSKLGSVKFTSALSSANFATAVVDDGTGNGAFKINGVTINYNATSDSLSSIVTKINDSTAGVLASYDSINDRMVLTNKTTGDVGIALEDVAGKGNLLAAAKLTTGTLNHGKNLLYTVNGGGQLTSQSNTITADNSGITGLTVNALEENVSVTVKVTSDTSTIKTAINNFLTEYNKVQSLIDGYTASSTDSNGKVTAGLLEGDGDIFGIASTLRSMSNGAVSGLTGVIKQLDALGIVSNGNDNTLKLSDSSKLDDALGNHLSEVKSLFTNSTSGLAVRLSSYIGTVAGEDGLLASHQTVLSKQSTAIDTQIDDMERRISSYQTQLTKSFVAMETAQSNINQQLTYLTKTFGD